MNKTFFLVVIFMLLACFNLQHAESDTNTINNDTHTSDLANVSTTSIPTNTSYGQTSILNPDSDSDNQTTTDTATDTLNHQTTRSDQTPSSTSNLQTTRSSSTSNRQTTRSSSTSDLQTTKSSSTSNFQTQTSKPQTSSASSTTVLPGDLTYLPNGHTSIPSSASQSTTSQMNEESSKDRNGPGPVIITLSLIACLTVVLVIGFFIFTRTKRRMRGRNYFRQLDQYQDDLLDYEIGIDTNSSNFVLDDMDMHEDHHYSSRPHLA